MQLFKPIYKTGLYSNIYQKSYILKDWPISYEAQCVQQVIKHPLGHWK